MRREPKKTDFLEVRLPTETKAAFMEACRADGRSASMMVRGWIDCYLRNASRASFLQIKELKMLFKTHPVKAALSSLAIASLGTVVALSGPASAAADARLEALFSSMDSNHDRRVSAAEFQASTSRSQGTGAMAIIVSTRTPPPAGETREALFNRIDANRDRLLDLSELEAAAVVQTKMSAEIIRADSDGDRSLTPGELAAYFTAHRASAGEKDPSAGAGLLAHGVVREHDRNGDGKVALAELDR